MHEIVSFSLCYSMQSLGLKNLKVFLDTSKHMLNKDSLNHHLKVDDLFDTIGVSISVDYSFGKLIDSITVYCGVNECVTNRLQDIQEILI